jgi:hypothetical protein
MPTRVFDRPSRARRYALLLAAAAAACLVSLAALPGSGSAAATSGPCPPPPSAPATPGGVLPPPTLKPTIPAPTEVVLACVGQYPITGAAFDQWAKVARAGSTPEHSSRDSKPHPLPVRQTIDAVMSFLITGDWVIGEAARLGISVSEETVRRGFDRLRREQFPHPREFRRFLRETDQTIADLLLRVRLEILSRALRKRLTHPLPNDLQKTQSEFVNGFKVRWQPQTVCAKAFTVPDCGSTQEPRL